MQRGTSDVLIIGGGIIGLACAYYLAEEGYKVRLLEKDRIGAGASHGNCGLLFYSELIPLCQPGVISRELSRVLRKDSPLHVPLDTHVSKYLWLLRFAAKCNRFHFKNAVRARAGILGLSKVLYSELMEKEGLECDWHQNGVLVLHRDPADKEAYGEANSVLRPYGAEASPVSRPHLLEMLPVAHGSVCGAWYHRQDGHVRPETLLERLGEVVLRKGVMVEEQCHVHGFSSANGNIEKALTSWGDFSAGMFVLAAGAWSPLLARQLSLRLPVYPGKGYSLTMKRLEDFPCIPCYFSEARVVATPWRDGFRLGGTLEFSGYNQRLERARIKGLAQAAESYLNCSPKSRATEEWTGMRPMSVDDVPVIGRSSRWRNLIIATGHGILGLSMAPGTGKIVSRIISNRDPLIDIGLFSPGRFGKYRT